jgi:phytoene dehydrogenase-like protein
VSVLSAKFKNPVLRKLFLNALDWGPMCSAFALWTIGLMMQHNAGYPIGGSTELIRSVEKRYLELGGRIHFHSKVSKILTKNNIATGIQLADGSIREADIVISAADGRTTIFDWLDGKYLDKKIKKIYDSFILFPPLVFVSMGINGKFTDAPHSLIFELDDPFKIGPDEITSLFVKNYSFDPTMAPEGKCVFTTMISSNFEYWEALDQNKDRYEEEKKRIGQDVVKRLGQVYPGFEQKVEVIDVASPMTFVRYTGNYRGAYQGFFLDKEALKILIPQQLPGLKNFYMAGQWVSPGGGLPSGLITGRNAIRKICKSEKKEFVSFV